MEKTNRVMPPGRNVRSLCLVWILLGALLGMHGSRMDLHAQVSLTGRGKNFVAPVTDAQGRKTVLRGKDFKPAGQGTVEINGMQAETYRGADKDMIVQAPHCVFDPKRNVASSPGSLSIRTADQRFSIEGDSFLWQLGDSRLSSKLVISNQVHSTVRKRLVQLTPALDSRPPTPGDARKNVPLQAQTSAAVSTNELINITSDQFEYESDRAVFRGHVRVHDVETDLACQLLLVIFGRAGASVERIEAEEDVVLVQGSTRVLAEKAVYTVGQDQEIVEFFGRAIWQDGGRQGSGDRITFDRRQRTVRAEENAYLKLPRGSLGAVGFLSTAALPALAVTNAPAAFVEVFADVLAMQLPATNGPVQEIVAEKNVLIVDPEQDGRALADRAVFQEATGQMELTGSPMLETERRLVTGQTLRFDSVTRVFTAGPDAYVKLPFQMVANLGIFPAPQDSMFPAQTNQFIELWSTDFAYGTNLLHFTGGVRANFLEGDLPLGKLTCSELTIRYGAELESMAADGMVEFEQFPSRDAPLPLSRKVNCERLRVKFTPAGHLELAVAQQDVSAEQEEIRPNQPRPVLTSLTSESVTAFFGPTNSVDRIVADENVVFRQDDRSARGAKAVYTESSGLVELTGQPTATMPEGRIIDAERLIWDRVHARFIGKGKFKSEWKQPPRGPQSVSGVEMGAE